MFDSGTVYIGRDVNIFDLLERDDDEEIQRLINEDRLRQFDAAAFEPRYRRLLQHDLAMLREIQAMWEPVTADPKLDQFVHELKHNPLLKGKQAIIFTESSETGAYLSEQLEGHFAGKVLAYNSAGGRQDGKNISKPVARQMIEQNYDPGHQTRKKDIRILISTDVLAEGINLHRSNIVINYDLPWNPTRVLQRVGRVNRVGTKHPDIFIFNFFPTSQSDEHLGLEANITAKLQAFHDTLGEDAKYLSEEEDVSQHELFGDRLFNTLNRKETYLGEEEGQSELEFLQIMRHLRDNDPQLFKKIKRLPKKARAGRNAEWDLNELPTQVLVSFFRRGRLKKFYLAAALEPVELTFLDAANWLRCEPDTPRQAIPKDYYEMLERNKQVFAEATSGEDDDLTAGGSRSHVSWLIRYIKAILKAPQLTDDQEDFLQQVLEALEHGVPSKKTTQRLRRALDKVSDPLKGVGTIRANIPTSLLQPQSNDPLQDAPIEVILSAYFQHQPAAGE